MARLAGSSSEAGATKTAGCWFQYAENSTKEMVPRIKGGAVMEERSPLKDAIDCKLVSSCLADAAIFRARALRCIGWDQSSRTLRNEVQEPLFCGAIAPPSSLEDMVTMGDTPEN